MPSPNLIMALIALLVLIGAGISGYQLRGTACGKQMAEMQAAAAQAERDAAARVVAEYQRIERENRAIESAYLDQQQAREARHARTKNRLFQQSPAHQRTDGDCNLSRGAVGLLNDAARGDEPGTDTAGLAAAEAAAASGITESAALEHCRGWAEQYESTAAQLNALIDWHEHIHREHGHE